MEYITFIKANWAPMLATLVIMIFIAYHLLRWLEKPREQQISDMKEWLKFAVIEAEKSLGSGTGEVKLRNVYDKAIVTFPWMKTFVSFEKFNEYVIEALDWMENELTENPSIAAYVGRR